MVVIDILFLIMEIRVASTLAKHSLHTSYVFLCNGEVSNCTAHLVADAYLNHALLSFEKKGSIWSIAIKVVKVVSVLVRKLVSS